MDGLIYDSAGAPYGQRELVRRRLERQCELRREPEQVERWQPGVFSKLLFFSSAMVGEFLFALFSLANLSSNRRVVGRFHLIFASIRRAGRSG